MKRLISLFLSLFVLLSFPSCGAGSRNEASFPENTPAHEAATLSPSPSSVPTPEPSTLSVAYDAEFMTDDGLIAVSVHVPDADPIPSAMPVLRAVPQEITSDMARQMAEAVFGDTPLYEQTKELSKAEIAEMIKKWEVGVLDESFLDDCGPNATQEQIDAVRDLRLEILDYYRNAYADARDEVTPVPCQWKFWPTEHYSTYGFDYAGTEPSYTSSFPFGQLVSLEATATVGAIPYTFSVSNYDRGDFRCNALSILIDEPSYPLVGGRTAEDAFAFRSAWNSSLGLYSPEPATKQQLEDACAWAGQLAADMGLGEFQFTAKALDCTDHPGGGWQIELEGLPLYQGFPLLRQGREPNIGPGGMYDEALTIVINNDGTLIHLNYYTPLVVEEAEPVPLIDADQTKAAAESFMHSFTYSDLVKSFDKPYLDEFGIEITEASLAVDSAYVGYTRVEDGGSGFLLVPSVVFWGNPALIGTEADFSDEPRDLLTPGANNYRPVLALDLRDGSRLFLIEK